jgi:hypothetical protein
MPALAEGRLPLPPVFPHLPDLSRDDALALGALVDVTPLAQQQGFLVAVAVSRNLWDDLQAVPAGEASGDPGEDVRHRLADILFMARRGIAGEPLLRLREMVFSLKLPIAGNEAGVVCGGSDDYTVRLVSHGGDAGEPVLTLFRQGEHGPQAMEMEQEG